MYLGGSSSYCYDGGAASDGLNGLVGTRIQNSKVVTFVRFRYTKMCIILNIFHTLEPSCCKKRKKVPTKKLDWKIGDV